MPDTVLKLSDIDSSRLNNLLNKYQLKLVIVHDENIPGSYWGDAEAGLIGNKLYARLDTPIHSIMHESCHYICMDNQRRAKLDTNAEGDYDEENGVCYLQILLANDIPEMLQGRMMTDMDSWGYTFRLGSTQKWFEQDAEDAFNWLKKHHLLTQNKPNFQLRQ
ncbi:MAG: hypothetical protein HOM14_12845 [Gammaproteobacteria bacterium]|jgi:hypothetical protein|nr:hypothetical protein [Gammaproteobacteria bacterium]MBT3723489.1 hypothetical protein [Gammaproteobacteria bacterium]MBT4076569.1 hypothetical protein [Gammaproteobacteria bacterium]MBT4194303.1 hypothetical protein [Gammaproteobacteria bacterium]MBT4450857.1 hypothetical protein [Gammaproteobacteria bacterium]